MKNWLFALLVMLVCTIDFAEAVERQECMQCSNWERGSVTSTEYTVYKICTDQHDRNILALTVNHDTLANIDDLNRILISGADSDNVSIAMVSFQDYKTGKLTSYMTKIQANPGSVIFDKSDSSEIVQRLFTHDSVIVTMVVDDYYVSSIIPLWGFGKHFDAMIEASLKSVTMPTQEELMTQYVDQYMGIMLNQYTQ